MYHNDTRLFIEKTEKNHFYCETECAQATSFKIWTLVNGTKSKYTFGLFHKQEGNISQ